MKIKHVLVLVAGFVFGVVTHSIKGQLYQRLKTNYAVKNDVLLVQKGILRNKVHRIKFSEITSVDVKQNFGQRFLGHFEVTLYLTDSNSENISITTNYSDLNLIRKKVEEEWVVEE